MNRVVCPCDPTAEWSSIQTAFSIPTVMMRSPIGAGTGPRFSLLGPTSSTGTGSTPYSTRWWLPPKTDFCTLSAHCRRRSDAGSRRMRARIHGQLSPLQLDPLVAQCWLGLSSFGLCGKGMTEACTLKVRDYLRAGLPAYAGHRDSALPDDFEYFRQGPPQWRAILDYARAVRGISRPTIALAARPLIDKKVLLERLHGSLNDSSV